MIEAEECLWKELVAIVGELDRVLAVAARDPSWREKHSVDYARFTVLSAKFSGMRASIEMLQQRERGGGTMSEDHYIPAQPGLKLAVVGGEKTELNFARNTVRLVPIVAWMMLGSDRLEDMRKSFRDHCNKGTPEESPYFDFMAILSNHTTPWAVTVDGVLMPGNATAAVVFPDGKVFEPGHHWHDSVEHWINVVRTRRGDAAIELQA